MMARASRELAIPHSAQHPPQRLLGDSDAKFLENPLAEIDDPPAHDLVNRRDWAALDDHGERGAIPVVQPRRLPSRLAVNQPVRALGVELDQPSRTTCKPDAPDLRRLSARRAVVNHRTSQKPARLRPALPHKASSPSARQNHPEAEQASESLSLATLNQTRNDPGIAAESRLQGRGLVIAVAEARLAKSP
jgi:hypothetical protein